MKADSKNKGVKETMREGDSNKEPILITIEFEETTRAGRKLEIAEVHSGEHFEFGRLV